MQLFHGTNVTSAVAIRANGFAGDHVCVSSDQGSALGRARCGTGTDGPCALITLDVQADERTLRRYFIDQWEDDDPPKLDYKLPLAEFAGRITVTSVVPCDRSAFS